MEKNKWADITLEIDNDGFVNFRENRTDVHEKCIRWILRSDVGWSAFIEHVNGTFEHLFNTETVQVPETNLREWALNTLFNRYANNLSKYNIP